VRKLLAILAIAAAACFGQVAGDPILGGTAIVDAGTGFRIGGAATTGRYLRANGSEFVQSSVAAAGAGSCTNQFVRATVDNAAPTCASVGNTDVSASAAIDASKLSAAARDRTHGACLENPTTADNGRIKLTWEAACTMQRIFCSTDTGTVTGDLDERAEATPNTDGTEVIDAGAGGIVCDNNTESALSFANASIAQDVPVVFKISATASSPGWVCIHARCRLD